MVCQSVSEENKSLETTCIVCLFIKSELGNNFVAPAFIFPSAALAWLRDLCDYLQKITII